ncbi:ankyrin repeat protein-like protein [Aureobasidium pullulans]|nr:ankyrin repeat protein-like protein [Aureobasidium pullulans]
MADEVMKDQIVSTEQSLIYLKGASSRELLLEACRRNNTDLLSTVLSDFKSTDELANFLNTATDALGCGALHIGAQYGAYEILDMLLDQEGVEIDGVERREGDTCLHKAVRYVNSLTKDEWEEGQAIVDILIDAGCDPRYVAQVQDSQSEGLTSLSRIRNKAKLRPIDLTDPRNTELRSVLQKAEFTMLAGDDVVQEDDDDADAGSASDSE